MTKIRHGCPEFFGVPGDPLNRTAIADESGYRLGGVFFQSGDIGTETDDATAFGGGDIFMGGGGNIMRHLLDPFVSTPDRQDTMGCHWPR